MTNPLGRALRFIVCLNCGARGPLRNWGDPDPQMTANRLWNTRTKELNRDD